MLQEIRISFSTNFELIELKVRIQTASSKLKIFLVYLCTGSILQDQHMTRYLVNLQWCQWLRNNILQWVQSTLHLNGEVKHSRTYHFLRNTCKEYRPLRNIYTCFAIEFKVLREDRSTLWMNLIFLRKNLYSYKYARR